MATVHGNHNGIGPNPRQIALTVDYAPYTDFAILIAKTLDGKDVLTAPIEIDYMIIERGDIVSNLKCGRTKITHNSDGSSYVGKQISCIEFENPICVATLHTEGNNPEGLPLIVKTNHSKSTSDMITIVIATPDGSVLPSGEYYADYIISELTSEETYE